MHYFTECTSMPIHLQSREGIRMARDWRRQPQHAREQQGYNSNALLFPRCHLQERRRAGRSSGRGCVYGKESVSGVCVVPAWCLRATGRQGDRATGRQGDRATGRQSVMEGERGRKAQSVEREREREREGGGVEAKSSHPIQL